MAKASTPSKQRSKAPNGTQAGRVWVPLSLEERQKLDNLAQKEERGASAMARRIYLAGLKAIEAGQAA